MPERLSMVQQWLLTDGALEHLSNMFLCSGTVGLLPCFLAGKSTKYPCIKNIYSGSSRNNRNSTCSVHKNYSKTAHIKISNFSNMAYTHFQRKKCASDDISVSGHSYSIYEYQYLQSDHFLKSCLVTNRHSDCDIKY